jgi:hypothetical protein
MNSYWIKTKEVAKKGYFIDGKSKEDAIVPFFIWLAKFIPKSRD